MNNIGITSNQQLNMNGIANATIKKVRQYCEDCYGVGEVSSCCNSDCENGRCLLCGRYCKEVPCDNCWGQGYIDYEVGDEVEIFVCAYSDEYLWNSLHKPKHIEDSKTFTGKIKSFIDDKNAVVRIGRKEVNIEIKDLSIR